MVTKKSRNVSRQKRHLRVRKNVVGTSTLPRLNVFRSNQHIYAQIIDDSKHCTLVSASSNDKELKLENGSNIEAAKKVGELVAKRALALSIKAPFLSLVSPKISSLISSVKRAISQSPS